MLQNRKKVIITILKFGLKTSQNEDIFIKQQQLVAYSSIALPHIDPSYK